MAMNRIVLFLIMLALFSCSDGEKKDLQILSLIRTGPEYGMTA